MMKKAISVVLSVLLLLTSASVGVLAADGEKATDYPVVMVPGYATTDLVYTDANGKTLQVWHPSWDRVKSYAFTRLSEFLKQVNLDSHADAHAFGDVLGKEMEDMMEYFKMNPDGTPAYNTTIANPKVEETNFAYIEEHNLPGSYMAEGAIMSEIAETVGKENCFSVSMDWRRNAVDCAKRLDEYIQEVKGYTGKSKVNLIAVSHGGQVSATYLSLYGYKKDVYNAVLTVPAAGGAALAYDGLSGNAKFDLYTMAYFVQQGMISKDNYKWMVKAADLGLLNDVVDGTIPHILNLIKYFGSIWDFVPAEYYDGLRDQLLDKDASAALIEKSDYMHHVIMPNYHQALTDCIEKYGMHVSIIAGTDHQSVTGLKENSDAIITVNSATGATAAPWGQRYNDGYTGAKTTCADPTHNHISPSLEIDGSTAYLPENTWYSEGLFHGMTFNDAYSDALVKKLLLTDDIKNVDSDPEYPQFHAVTNRNSVVFAKFNASPEGRLSDADTSIRITNLSKDYPIKITSIMFEGVDLNTSILKKDEIAPETTVEVPITGTLPKESGRLVQVQIDYYTDGNKQTPIGSRTLNFMLTNGEQVAYDTANPYVAANYTTPLEEKLGTDNVVKLQKFSVIDIMNYVYRAVSYLLTHLTNLSK